MALSVRDTVWQSDPWEISSIFWAEFLADANESQESSADLYQLNAHLFEGCQQGVGGTDQLK